MCSHECRKIKTEQNLNFLYILGDFFDKQKYFIWYKFFCIDIKSRGLWFSFCMSKIWISFFRIDSTWNFNSCNLIWLFLIGLVACSWCDWWLHGHRCRFRISFHKRNFFQSHKSTTIYILSSPSCWWDTGRWSLHLRNHSHNRSRKSKSFSRINFIKWSGFIMASDSGHIKLHDSYKKSGRKSFWPTKISSLKSIWVQPIGTIYQIYNSSVCTIRSVYNYIFESLKSVDFYLSRARAVTWQVFNCDF